MPRHAEELIGPECLWHQNTLLLVVPLDPHSTTFAAGAPPVNLANDFLATFLEALRNVTPRSHPAESVHLKWLRTPTTIRRIGVHRARFDGDV